MFIDSEYELQTYMPVSHNTKFNQPPNISQKIYCAIIYIFNT